MTLVPSKVILSAFGYVPTPTPNAHDDLIELMVIIQYINHQLSSHTAFPWSLDSYFTFRMIQHPRTKEDYKIAMYPPQYSPSSPHVIPESHSPSVKPSGSYHITPPTCLSHHEEDVSIQSFQQGGNRTGSYQNVPAFRSFKSYVDRMNRHMDDGSVSTQSQSHSQTATTRTLSDELISIRRKRNEAYNRLYAPPKIRSNISSDKLQWNGHRSTFLSFANDFEGNMIHIGIVYMLNLLFKNRMNNRD